MSRRMVVEAAGWARRNAVAAGYGAVVRDADSGEVLAETAEGIGAASPVAAAYHAVRAGLLAAASVEAIAAEVEVRTDAKSVVEQLGRGGTLTDAGDGGQSAADPDPAELAVLAGLADEAAHAASAFGADTVSFSWVPRDRNADAVRLARQVADRDAWGRPWVRTAVVEVPAPEPESQPPEEPLASLVPPAPATTTVLVRAGETELSRQRRFAGVGDDGLTDAGGEQAKLLAEYLFTRGDVDVVAASPLRSAQQTAWVVADALGLSVVTEPGLRETDFGDWEGLTFAEAQAGWPDELAGWLDNPLAAPPGGESFHDTAARVERARDTLLGHFPHRTVVVVTHVTAIKTLVRLALDAPPVALHRMHLDAGCVTEIDWHDQGAVVRSLNDTRHLDPR